MLILWFENENNKRFFNSNLFKIGKCNFIVYEVSKRNMIIGNSQVDFIKQKVNLIYCDRPNLSKKDKNNYLK